VRTPPLRFTVPAVVLLVTISFSASTQKAGSASGRVLGAATMNDACADHTATRLKDGHVLIAGGMVEKGVFLNTSEWACLRRKVADLYTRNLAVRSISPGGTANRFRALAAETATGARLPQDRISFL